MTTAKTDVSVTVNGTTMPAPFAARLIVSNIHRECFVGDCPVWPTVVRDGSLDLVRWMDAAGNVRAMARV